MTSKINFFSEGITYRIKSKKQICRWLEEVILIENRITGDINLVLTSDDLLLQYNIKYLNTDSLTDIISFNFSEENKIISGDIYISIDRVRENAKKYKVTIEEELVRLFIHGILHLIGYNDLSVKEKRGMTALENKYLEQFLEKLTLMMLECRVDLIAFQRDFVFFGNCSRIAYR